MALDLGTLVAKVKVDDDDFDKKTSGWSQKGAGVASAFGNVAADAISQATSMLSEFVGEAMVASDATFKFAKTLEFAGLDTTKIDQLKKSTQEYADQTVYSLSDIQQITATLAANGVEGYDSLAMALGNLNAIAGGNAETFGRVGSVLTQTAGAGKLTTENWNQLSEAIPGASGKLMDALLQAGAYTGNFRDAMAEGQITSEEFNAAIQQVGMDPIAVEAAKSVETFEGAQGNAAAALQSQLVKALDMVKPAITGLMNGVADFITNIEAWLPVIAGIGAAILYLMAPALWAAVTATWAWTAALLANPVTWIVLAIVALVAGIVWLIQNWDTAVSFITEVWGGFIEWITGVIDGFLGWWNGVWTAISDFFTGIWEGVVEVWTTVWQSIVDFFTPIVEFIASIIQVYVEIWVNVFLIFAAVLKTIWDGIAAAATWVWEQISSFLTPIITGIVSFVTGTFNAVASWWTGVWNAISSFFKGVWDGIVAFLLPIVLQISSFITNAVNTVQGIWNSVWGAISGFFSGIWSGMVGAVSGAIDQIFGFIGGIYGTVMGFFGGVGDWLLGVGEDLIGGLIQGITNMIGGVIDAIGDVVNGAIDWAKDTLGIHSPSTVFRAIGVNTGEGYLEGLGAMEDPIQAELNRMLAVPPMTILTDTDADAAAARGGAKVVNYYAAEGQSLSDEEALFAALGSPRVKD